MMIRLVDLRGERKLGVTLRLLLRGREGEESGSSLSGVEPVRRARVRRCVESGIVGYRFLSDERGRLFRMRWLSLWVDGLAALHHA